MTKVASIVPVLQVSNVEQSIDWYRSVLGFEADPFPDTPPYSFAILRRDGAEVMLQRREGVTGVGSPNGWSVYLRLTGGNLLQFAEVVRTHTELARAPERAFYGQVEFEVVDPDGHLVCVAEPLPDDADVPRAREA